MSLNKKQVRFTKTLGKFLVWCADNGFQVIAAELFRTPEQAAIYAKQGKGIKNSVHTKKLAVDLFLLKDGKITWNTEDYRPLGEKWISMDTDARWGGVFKNRDAVHFSFTHGGFA
jgi:hypothetical protein